MRGSLLGNPPSPARLKRQGWLTTSPSPKRTRTYSSQTKALDLHSTPASSDNSHWLERTTDDVRKMTNDRTNAWLSGSFELFMCVQWAPRSTKPSHCCGHPGAKRPSHCSGHPGHRDRLTAVGIWEHKDHLTAVGTQDTETVSLLWATGSTETVSLL